MFMSLNARAMGLTLPAAETIELAAAAGFGGVDLLVRDVAESGADPAALRARMDRLGLRGGAFPLPVDWRGEAATFARDLERLPALAAVAAALRLTRTGTWVVPECPPGEDRATTAAWHVERLGRVARVLDAHGIRLGLEVIGVASSRGGRGAPFVHRMADLGTVLGPLGREAPNVGVLVDAFHIYAAGESIEAGLAWGVGRVVWAHVADLPPWATADRACIRDELRGLPGEHGAVESRRLLAILAEGGYDGPVTAEPLAGCSSLEGQTPEQAVRRVAAALRSVWPMEGK
jgi:sugar phosphate isomerase/epimerase